MVAAGELDDPLHRHLEIRLGIHIQTRCIKL